MTRTFIQMSDAWVQIHHECEKMQLADVAPSPPATSGRQVTEGGFVLRL